MRNIITFILLIIFTDSFSQNTQISGQITLSNYVTEYKDLTILLIQKDSIITGAVPNETGYFKLIKKVPNGNYSIKITQIATQDFVIDNVDIYDDKEINLNILYPGKCKYLKTKKPKCTENHFDNIIPIVYGYPSKEMGEKAKKEKIYLGGCLTSDCDPNYYCKIHKIRF